ncbi:hypothetical protein NMY22_g8366 [Coprinellus aureogranulatus]|nr:hypothetical protein NMY22_g8366 [Coprinellus aureogranulatus]
MVLCVIAGGSWIVGRVWKRKGSVWVMCVLLQHQVLVVRQQQRLLVDELPVRAMRGLGTAPLRRVLRGLLDKGEMSVVGIVHVALGVDVGAVHGGGGGGVGTGVGRVEDTAEIVSGVLEGRGARPLSTHPDRSGIGSRLSPGPRTIRTDPAQFAPGLVVHSKQAHVLSADLPQRPFDSATSSLHVCLAAAVVHGYQIIHVALLASWHLAVDVFPRPTAKPPRRSSIGFRSHLTAFSIQQSDRHAPFALPLLPCVVSGGSL